MNSRDEALACARRLAALPGEGALRRLAAARELTDLDPTEAAWLLDLLVREAHGGADAARIALTALLSALGQEAAFLAPPLLAAAHEESLEAVEALVTRSPPARAVQAGREAPREVSSLALSLGHLKWKARLTRSPDELARLAVTAEPAVVRNLLQNPRLTEEVVVRLAARRPVRQEVLVEVWRSPRWNVRRAVRRALAFNPYLPPDVGARIIPLLTRPDWEELSRDLGLQPEVRAQASRLLRESYPREASLPESFLEPLRNE
jgi:hypothetical protein